jgi:hypothetical protein
METLLIKIARPQKVNSLIQILKSLDFVASVTRIDNYLKVKKLFDDINTESYAKGLSKISDEEIQKVIQSYRNEK